MAVDEPTTSEAGQNRPVHHRRRERCPTCNTETDHDVTLGIVTESDRPTAADSSREPYRITTCRVCGAERHQRMNRA